MGKYLLCLFFILLSFDSIDSYLMPPLFRKFNVEIVNQLEFHKILRVHCKSKSHDFPITYLNIGESFQFKFTIFPKTLYWCNLWQGPNYKHYVVFAAFRPDKDFIDGTCTGMHPNVCRWTAKEEGVYVRNKQFEGEYFMYTWDAPSKIRKIPPVNAPSSESEFDS
ncbi:Plant self-incompatibility S1 [Arabidopsis thaliana x Arabidopsis arenosa]|uniref:S-protein homolog n=1 Tax=Arabidopsis thaliana x Arabidopsis arenosa TaxID=1240361 RepID=A0A8T1Y225_9BRAS|nr:Plant self-incompatibility S1 [Arabidopsis thaliana x Arabidopsis arenosa]